MTSNQSQTGGGSGGTRRSTVLTRKKTLDNGRSSLTAPSPRPPTALTGERTVKRLRLTKALTVPDSTTISEACRRMAARKVDALLLTDSNALLCGILTDRDITTRVVARELDIETTPVSAVMTKNPVFVISDTLAVEALQKMVLGKFRHLPVVENGEVVAILDIAKCLYDAIARMERAAEKVMTPNPNCATIDTPIIDALHTMHDGKFFHLPIVDGDVNIVATTDVLHITHAAIASVGSTAGIDHNAASSMMQNFWDSAMAAPPADDDSDTRSESSFKFASEAGTDIGKAIYHPPTLSNTFAFKIQDRKGRMHRFICETHSLTDLITAILQRVGGEIDRNNLPHILYEDEDKDKVILATDSDLAAAVEHARSAGWKGLKLHLDYSGMPKNRKGSSAAASGGGLEQAHPDAWASAYSSVAAGAALVAGLGVLAFMRRA